MFKGELVEMATREELFESPVHPYTKALLDVVPHANLDHPLDFDRINKDMSAEGRNWPAPFSSLDDGSDMDMISITDNHQVRALRGTAPESLTRSDGEAS